MEFIEGSERVAGIFGGWPSFHDAEVLGLAFERRKGEGCSILLVLHTWQSTGEVDELGYFKLAKHTRVTLRFVDCDQLAFSCDGFNHQNVIHRLDIARGDVGAVRVGIEAIYGVGGSFRCKAVQVVEAVSIQPGQQGEFRYADLRPA